jgi:hypothetical protein
VSDATRHAASGMGYAKAKKPAERRLLGPNGIAEAKQPKIGAIRSQWIPLRVGIVQ